MKRYPHGIDGEVVLPEAGAEAPAALDPDAPVPDVAARRRLAARRLRARELAARRVLFMVQNNCIDMNAWYSRVDKPDRPDFVLFDLDPPDGGFELAIEVAHLIRELLDEVELAGLRQDERRRRHPRRRADHAPLDLPADVRLRRAGVAPARAAAPGQGHDRVAEEEAGGRPRRPPPERPRQDDRVGLLRPPQARRAGVDAAALGGADAGRQAARLHDAGRARADRGARRPLRARAGGSAAARAGRGKPWRG